jgi:hypothetical protein
MTTSLRAGVIAVSAVALGLSLAGCGSDTKSEPSASKTTSSEASITETTDTTKTSAAAPTTSAQATGKNYTIVDYIRDNGIVEIPVKRGDPGSPTIDPAFKADPPTIVALVSKLTGNVDPAKVLEFAPGEIQNLPGFEGGAEGTADELSGFDAMQLGGTYKKDGVSRAIAQKTVVIPGKDGLYVLQLNADGLEDQIGALMDATSAIDEQTTITP